LRDHILLLHLKQKFVRVTEKKEPGVGRKKIIAMPYCDVGTHKIYYELHGSGPTKVILTMGLGGTFNQWEPQIDFFTEQGGYQLCVYDNRGIGYSSSPKQFRWKTSDMANDAIKLLDHLEWKAEVNAIGLSMGGMITQELVLADPKRFTSVALISTIAGGLPSLFYFLLAIPTGLICSHVQILDLVRLFILKAKFIFVCIHLSLLRSPAEGVRVLASTFISFEKDPVKRNREMLINGLKLLYPEEALNQVHFFSIISLLFQSEV
jgi:pimeloyl-ACP methyl ester carboxylesterase